MQQRLLHKHHYKTTTLLLIIQKYDVITIAHVIETTFETIT